MIMYRWGVKEESSKSFNMKELIDAAKDINTQLPYEKQIRCFNDSGLLEKKILEVAGPLLNEPGKLNDKTVDLIKKLVGKEKSDGHNNLYFRRQSTNPKATCASHERIRMIYLQRTAARNE